MVLLFLAAVAAKPVPEPRVQARALVRIERPVRASREDWERRPEGERRERRIVDEQGRPLLLRLIELP